MKSKNLVFLLLVLSIVFISGCTSGSSSSGLSSSSLEQIIRKLGGPIAIAILGFLTALGLGIAAIIAIVILALFVLPFMTLCAIIYGFLSELRIFRSRTVNLTITITLALSTLFIPLPIIGTTLFFGVLNILYTLMASWAVLVFTLMFFVGTWYLFLTRRAKWGTTAGVYAAYHQEAKGLSFELRETNEALAEAMRKMARETDPVKRASLEKSIQELNDRRNDISERIRGLDQARRQF